MAESTGTWSGVSIGGFATCVDFPRYKLTVDVGRLVEASVARPNVLITHGHADHVGALAQHVAQRGLRGLEPATYHVPPGLGRHLEELLEVWREMDGGELSCHIVEWEPGTPKRMRPDLEVTPLATEHRVPSQGYLFEELRTTLRPDLVGAPTEAIIEAKERGESVEVTHRTPRLAISGDTTFGGMLGHEAAFSADVLFLECTFLDDRVEPERARDMGHVHLAEVAQHAEHFRCDQLVLYHVSPRHSLGQARDLVARALPEELAARTLVWG